MRRLLTRLLAIIPAIVVIYIFGDKEVDSLLVLSQVILSLQLGFAIIPLIHFVSDKQKMGDFVIKTPVKLIAWLIAIVLVYLNAKMVIGQITEFYAGPAHIVWKVVVGLAALGAALLLAYISFFPLLQKKKKGVSIQLHAQTGQMELPEIPSYKKIAVALDFSTRDHILLGHALNQGKKDTEYLLIHIVESVSARYLGKDSDDYETRTDQERLQSYISQLHTKGFKASGRLGYTNRAREIVRLVVEEEADLLIIGGHGHTGIKDWIYGETIESVRHELKIPVLIVSL